MSRPLMMALFGGAALLAAGSLYALSAALGLEENGAASQTPRLEEKVMGSANAPVTIIEYASMTCAHCAAFHATTFPILKREYIDSGKVRLIFREFPLDPWAAAASLLARCMSAERYFPFIKVLFDHQRTWVLARDRREALFRLARQSGMTRSSFDLCLENQNLLNGLQAIRDHAQRDLGVASTPTFFIEGERVEGNEPYGKLRRVIERHLR